MVYWWARLSPRIKLALLGSVLWLLIVAGSVVIFDFWSRGWQTWAELISAAFLASLVIVRTLIYIREKLLGPKIRPAKEDELLIVVAKFRGPESPDPQMYIARRLEADLLMHPALADRVRVSRFPAVIEEESPEAEIGKARVLGETYGATLVIWGEHDGHSAAARYLVTRGRERVATVVELQPSAATADLKEFVMHVSEELPKTMTYLSLFTIGQMYYFANEHSQAVSLFSAALDHFPSGEAYQASAAALRLYRGNTYLFLGKCDLAIADYNKAMELGPDLAYPYNNRGVSYYHKGQYSLAIADYSRAIELKPDFVEAYNNRGVAYYHKGQYSLAIADYSRAIELKPDFVEAYNNRGVAYAHNCEYDQAIANYDRAIKLKPDYAVAYNNRGNAYVGKNKHDLAITDYDRAIRLKPDFVEAYNNRGNAYAEKGEHDLAITDYDRAIRLKPNYSLPYHGRGFVYKKSGKKQKAIGDFERFLELSAAEYWRDEYWRKEAEEQLRELRGH